MGRPVSDADLGALDAQVTTLQSGVGNDRPGSGESGIERGDVFRVEMQSTPLLLVGQEPGGSDAAALKRVTIADQGLKRCLAQVDDNPRQTIRERALKSFVDPAHRQAEPLDDRVLGGCCLCSLGPSGGQALSIGLLDRLVLLALGKGGLVLVRNLLWWPG